MTSHGRLIFSFLGLMKEGYGSTICVKVKEVLKKTSKCHNGREGRGGPWLTRILVYIVDFLIKTKLISFYNLLLDKESYLVFIIPQIKIELFSFYNLLLDKNKGI